MKVLETIFISSLLAVSLFCEVNKISTSLAQVSSASIGTDYVTRISKENSHNFTKISLPITFDMYDEEFRRRYVKVDVMHLNDTVYERTQTAISSEIGIETQYMMLEAGITPIGLDIDPSLTALLSLHTSNDFFNAKATLVRKSMENSLASYVGDREHRSEDTWGRVLKNGLEAGLSYDSKVSYNLDFAYYPVIEGENTLENSEVQVFGSVLYHVAVESLTTLDYGVRVKYDTYENNNNLFLYGYGGYFSPEEYLSGDFIFNVANVSDSSFYWKLDSSIGYESYEVNEITTTTSTLIDAYSNSDLTYSMAMSMGLHYKNNLDMIMDASFESMYEYHVAKVALSFVYFFDK